MNNIKPKILFIGPTPPPYSGPELSMKQFLESDSLNEIFDINFLKTNFREDNVSKGKIDVAMFANFFIFFSSLLRFLIIIKPECVYYPVTPTQIGWMGRDVWTILISKLFGAKVIIHLRGSHFKLNFDQFNSVARWLTGLSLKKVDCGIVQASYLKNQFEPYLKSHKVVLLYQAMDTNEYINNSCTTVQKGKVLVVGHMTKAKGYTDILRIIPNICKDFPHVKFYFAGNIRKGERGVFFNQISGKKITYENPFEAEDYIMNSDYSKNYINLGVVSGKEKIRHFQSTDIFLSASYSEGFSRSLLEAMSVGKPLVYTPVGAHKEILEDGVHGFSFIPGELKQLENALREALSNDLLCKGIGDANRKYVIANFSLEKISEDFKTIILNTIDQ